MRRACERGVRVFDYGRSKRGTGSFDFKKNWGFEPTPLAYEFHCSKRDAIPQNNPLNPKYRALIALWKRLPRGAANALGPHIVREPRLTHLRWRPLLYPGAPDSVSAEQGRQGPVFPSAPVFSPARFRVHLGTFVDDPADLASRCATLEILRVVEGRRDPSAPWRGSAACRASGPARR